MLADPVHEGDHILGDSAAKTTLLEYGDFECPFCGEAYPIIKSILRKGGKNVRFVFRNFPLRRIHPNAEPAAEAAEAAAAQGKFWEMHDLLFEHQDALDLDALAGYAKVLKLDVSLIRDAIESEAYRARIEADFMGGVRSGVNGTPTFFLNGARLDIAFQDPAFGEVILRS